MNFDRIASSVPVNRQAAIQMANGDPADFRRALEDHYEQCPPLAQIGPTQKSNPNFLDFTGQTFGRLTVVGKMAKENDQPTSWVCKCKCGHYCTRRSKSLKVAQRGGNSFVPMCGRCWYLQKLRDGHQFQKPIKVSK